MNTFISDRTAIAVRRGVTQPSLFDIITFDGATQDMTGATVTFSMRPLLSRTPFVNEAAAVPLVPFDADGHNVRYDWAGPDVAVEGEYMGWWSYRLPGLAFEDTPEFSIIVTDHGPGAGTPTGVVIDGVSAYMPVTLSALRGDRRFGDRFLQRTADNVKRLVMGQVVSADAEALYDPALQDYLSKRTARALIAPAKDYWARQPRTQTVSGPAEMTVYPDMSAALDALDLRLEKELHQDWMNLQFIVPGLPQRHVEAMPVSSLGPSGPLTGPVTPDPNWYPARVNGLWGWGR